MILPHVAIWLQMIPIAILPSYFMMVNFATVHFLVINAHVEHTLAAMWYTLCSALATDVQRKATMHVKNAVDVYTDMAVVRRLTVFPGTLLRQQIAHHLSKILHVQWMETLQERLCAIIRFGVATPWWSNITSILLGFILYKE